VITALEALPFLGGNQVEGITSVLGDNDGFMTGLIADCAELAEFRWRRREWLAWRKLQYEYFIKIALVKVSKYA